MERISVVFRARRRRVSFHAARCPRRKSGMSEQPRGGGKRQPPRTNFIRECRADYARRERSGNAASNTFHAV